MRVEIAATAPGPCVTVHNLTYVVSRAAIDKKGSQTVTDKKFQIVVFGATSFVGQILCRYLLETCVLNSGLRWAVAGRSREKLTQLCKGLGAAAENLPVLIADAGDEGALKNLCEQTEVVVSTVGPYALFGEPLVKTCAETGTDYCDLTGEAQWIRRMLSKYESTAQRTGARIVHCCGFDSIPSDLGVYFVQQQARAQFSEPCVKIKMRVKAMSGGASGGTVASVINLVNEARKDPALRKELVNPYSICPENHGFKSRQKNVAGPEYDADFQTWIMPFVMAAINTRVVHRSNALQKNAYGTDFLYDEASLCKPNVGGLLTANVMSAGLGLFVLGVAIPPTKWLIENYLVPKPGEGPSLEAQEKGYFDFRFWGVTKSGQSLRCKVTGDRDPGYGSTAKMLGQAAMALAMDVSKEKCPGGFWTPASIFGQGLIERLVNHSGLKFEVLGK